MSTCEPIRPAEITRSRRGHMNPGSLSRPTHCIVPRRNLPTAAGRSLLPILPVPLHRPGYLLYLTPIIINCGSDPKSYR